MIASAWRSSRTGGGAAAGTEAPDNPGLHRVAARPAACHGATLSRACAMSRPADLRLAFSHLPTHEQPTQQDSADFSQPGRRA